MSAGITIYRVQDASGRGPWRPGFSNAWVDPLGKDHAPIFVEVPNFMDLIKSIGPKEHAGCGCESMERLLQWFTDFELARLSYFRFRIVQLTGCRILAKTPTQILFARNKPLRSGVVVIPFPSRRIELPYESSLREHVAMTEPPLKS